MTKSPTSPDVRCNIKLFAANPDRYEPAVKLAAAYPTNGVSIRRSASNTLEIVEALEELRMKALGELVISVGDDALRGVTLVWAAFRGAKDGLVCVNHP
jgi:hypothetical protein